MTKPELGHERAKRRGRRQIMAASLTVQRPVCQALEARKEGGGGVTAPEKCPRRESNPDLAFRKRSFYPLNYGDADYEALTPISPSETRKLERELEFRHFLP